MTYEKIYFSFLTATDALHSLQVYHQCFNVFIFSMSVLLQLKHVEILIALLLLIH